MGKYRSNARQQLPPRNQINGLVRGIGCLLFVLIPVVSYGLAVYWIGHNWPGTYLIPANLMGTPRIPPIFFSSPALASISSFVQRQTNLGANLVFALAFSMVISGVTAFLYGILYNMFGPSRYGPTDVPPPRVKTKKYTR